MSFQPKQKNNDLSLSQEAQNSESAGEFDVSTSSQHLENILGRINAIMTDGTPSNLKGQQQAEVPSSSTNDLQNTSSFEKPADLGAVSTQKTTETVSQDAALAETRGAEKFQVSEPLDMLQPYSEVLNEVRDYFNERHSLDPNDRLTNSQKSQSISDEVLGTPSLQEEIKRPKKVLLWGDAPLDPTYRRAIKCN